MTKLEQRLSSMDYDVEVLPRSGTLYMSIDPREKYADEFQRQNLLYIEQNYTGHYITMGDFKVLPNGADNMFPTNFKNLLDEVYLGHGVKRTLINLLLSGTLGLYQEKIEDGKIIRDWQLDNEIQDWLDSWRFEEEYLPEVATDMVYVENTWTAMKRNKGARLGNAQPKIAALEYFGVEDMRLQFVEQGRPTKAYMADWGYGSLSSAEIQEYPLFDYRNPLRHPVSFAFEKMPTFSSQGYGRPPEIGAMQMLKVLSLLPNFHYGNLTQKGFKWVVYIDQGYYEAVAQKNSWSPDSTEFLEWKANFKQQIDEFLISEDGAKVQTRFMAEFWRDKHNPAEMLKNVHIEKLEDDTKALSEVGLSLHDTYSVAYTSALGISPKMAKMHLKNHALSGSDLKEEYEAHIRTAAPPLRKKLLAPVNAAIRANWPNKRLKVGFQDSPLITPTNTKTTTNNQSDVI